MSSPGIRFIQAFFLLPWLGYFGCNTLSGQSRNGEPNVTIIPRARPTAAEKLPPSTFRLDVKLIQVPVQVTDQMDRPILNLPRSAFKLYQDDVEQDIATFSVSDAPISTGLVFDASKSMKDRIIDSRTAINQFCTTALPDDEFFLMKFSDSAELVAPFTRDPNEILRELNFVQPHGWTAMIDAIWRSVEEMRHARNPRKVLLVLSDGGDNNSRYSEMELLSMIRESDVRVYAIGLFQRPRFLERLAEATGGQVIWVHKLSELPDAMETLSLQIRNEYVVGYVPKALQNDGKYHRLRVEVQPPEGLKQVHASWRRGYMAP